MLRHFTLGGTELHDDEDARELTILTDDERPFVQYGERTQRTDRDEGLHEGEDEAERSE